MPITMTMSQLRSNLADALDQASKGAPVIVTRRGKNDAALVDIDLLEDILDISDQKLHKKIAQSRQNDETISLQDFAKEL